MSGISALLPGNYRPKGRFWDDVMLKLELQLKGYGRWSFYGARQSWDPLPLPFSLFSGSFRLSQLKLGQINLALLMSVAIFLIHLHTLKDYFSKQNGSVLQFQAVNFMGC